MKRKATFLGAAVVLGLLIACNPASPNPGPPSAAENPGQTAASTSSGSHLTPNPVETSLPKYGGTLQRGYWIPRSFDGHQKAAYGPNAQLPVFNQLVMFDINYKETVPETIIGDLAEKWETSPDGMAITFHIHHDVKWQDGVPFSADDVIYSLDKMTDPNRSAIADWFPAYETTEKIDDYTVKVHLKYPSAGFMLSLAQGESQIQALHLAGTDDQSQEFMVGTGPFILTEYLPQVHLKFKRNPEYFKKDKYGNRLPYLDGMVYNHLSASRTIETMASRRLDIMDTMTGASDLDTYNFLKDSAPELLWQKRERYAGSVIFLNTSKPPLDDVRVRRAIGMVLSEEDLVIGFSGDAMFGLTGVGILHPAFGLSKGEVNNLMGWDRPFEERVAQAQRLVAEAGYPDGFKLNLMSAEAGSRSNTGATLVFAEALRKYLKIDADLSTALGTIEIEKRLKENRYDTYTRLLDSDPLQLAQYFSTSGYSNFSHYSNSKMDEILADLDHVLDPAQRCEKIQEIERILLTDLPALPTGCFVPNYMPYYPQVKNLRWNYISYSNINRLEDVWLDESARVK